MKEETTNEFNPNVELSQEVEKNKFDNHMEAARKSTMKSSREIFLKQYEKSSDRKSRYSNIKPSIY